MLETVPVIEYGAAGVARATRSVSPEEAAISVEATGICGTDRHIVRGVLPVPSGTVLGHEIIGRIAWLPEADALRADWPVATGDRVVVAPGISCGTCPNCLRIGMYCTNRKLYGFASDLGPRGGLSPLVQLFPGTRVFRVPDDLPTALAVYIEPLACAVRVVDTALQTTGALVGRPVAVVGFGPVGLAVATVLHAHGALVGVIEPDPARQAVARRLGMAVVDPPDRDHPQAYELAVECAGQSEAFTAAAFAVRPGGTVVELGSFAPTGQSGLVPADICQRDLRVLGVSETCDTDFYLAVSVAATTPLPLADTVTDVPWSAIEDPAALFATGTDFKRMVTFEGSRNVGR
jgi:threonine dehydrogenase-like Zn-dependent dehydrogenase